MKKRHFGMYLIAAGLLIAPHAEAQRRKPARNNHAIKNKPAQKTPQKSVPATTIKRSSSNDTTIKSTTLEVYQVYKPEVKIDPKPSFTPTLPPPETAIVSQQYNVPQQALYYTYRSVPLRPLALGKDTVVLPAQNYIKAGGGNLSTIYADVGIGSLHGDNWETAIHAHHISQKGDIQGQQFWHTGLDATGTLHKGGHAWNAEVNADYRRFGLYGYDHDAFHFTDEDLRRTYTGINLRVGTQNEQHGLLGLDYVPFIRLNNFSSNDSSAHARTIEAAIPVSKKIDSNLTAELGLRGVFTHFADDRISSDNNIVQVLPALAYKQDAFTARLGLYPTFGHNNTTYLLPDIFVAYKTASNFDVKAGWQAQLLQNTFQQLALRNPFYAVLTGAPQTRTDEVFINANAGIGHHISVSARVSWWQYNNLPLFINYTGASDGRIFATVADHRINALSLQAAARYELANSFSIGLSGAWYGYYNKTEAHVWQEPSVRIKGDVQWRILKDLHANAYLSALGGMYARDISGYEQKMADIIDMGAGAEYQIVPRLSLWLNVGNLLNRPNQRWYGYDSFGINIYGGLRFRF